MANKKKYDIKATAQFKKDYKLAKKRGLDIKLLAKVINTLDKEGVLNKYLKLYAKNVYNTEQIIFRG